MDLRARLQIERQHGYTDVIQSILAIIPSPKAQPAEPERPPSPTSSVSDTEEERPAVPSAARPRTSLGPRTSKSPVVQQAATKKPVTLPEYFLKDEAWRNWQKHCLETGNEAKIVEVIELAEANQKAMEATQQQTQNTDAQKQAVLERMARQNQEAAEQNRMDQENYRAQAIAMQQARAQQAQPHSQQQSRPQVQLMQAQGQAQLGGSDKQVRFA